MSGQGEGVKGFGENGGYAEGGEPSLVGSLDAGSEEDYGYGGGLRVLLKEREGGGTIQLRHHDVHEDNIRLFGGCDFDSLAAGACGEDEPVGGGLEGERGYLADVVIVIDDEYAAHALMSGMDGVQHSCAPVLAPSMSCPRMS